MRKRVNAARPCGDNGQFLYIKAGKEGNIMKGVPNIYTPEILDGWDCAAQVNGRYVKARPLGWQGLSLTRRLKVAWKVFTGEYDALKWTGQ